MFCSFDRARFLRIAAYYWPLCLAVVLLGACGSEPATDTPTPVAPTPMSAPTVLPLPLQELSSYLSDFQEIFSEWHSQVTALDEVYPAAADPLVIQTSSVTERVDASLAWATQGLMYTKIANEQWQSVAPPLGAEESYDAMTDFLDSQETLLLQLIQGLSSAKQWTEFELIEFLANLEPVAMDGQRKQWLVMDMHKRLTETLQ